MTSASSAGHSYKVQSTDTQQACVSSSSNTVIVSDSANSSANIVTSIAGSVFNTSSIASSEASVHSRSATVASGPHMVSSGLTSLTSSSAASVQHQLQQHAAPSVIPRPTMTVNAIATSGAVSMQQPLPLSNPSYRLGLPTFSRLPNRMAPPLAQNETALQFMRGLRPEVSMQRMMPPFPGQPIDQRELHMMQSPTMTNPFVFQNQFALNYGGVDADHKGSYKKKRTKKRKTNNSSTTAFSPQSSADVNPALSPGHVVVNENKPASFMDNPTAFMAQQTAIVNSKMPNTSPTYNKSPLKPPTSTSLPSASPTVAMSSGDVSFSALAGSDGDVTTQTNDVRVQETDVKLQANHTTSKASGVAMQCGDAMDTRTELIKALEEDGLRKKIPAKSGRIT